MKCAKICRIIRRFAGIGGKKFAVAAGIKFYMYKVPDVAVVIAQTVKIRILGSCIILFNVHPAFAAIDKVAHVNNKGWKC